MKEQEIETILKSKIPPNIMQTQDEGGYLDLSADFNNSIRINDSKLCLGIQENLEDLNEMFCDFPKAFNAITDDYE